MITFGKHKGKTYDYMIKNEKSYCLFVLNQQICSGGFKEFQNFLKNNNEKLYDINELKNKNIINCSELKNYMFYDINVINIIQDIQINDTDKDKISTNDKIEQ